MVMVKEEFHYTTSFDTLRKNPGYYMSSYLKSNLDNYFIKAVEKKFDGILLVTGIEGSGKTTLGSTICKYCDDTFPGELLNDNTQRRKCDRIVFTQEQIMDAIDNAKPQQAILIDEGILSMFSQDAGSDLQRILIKKFVTIRKKRLFIIIVIPTIFMLRKYFAIFRTRALLHCVLQNGIERGTFYFYSYNKKKSLYLKGIKDFNQSAEMCDFASKFTNTEGYFYDPKEYDDKKENAIRYLTKESEEPKIVTQMREAYTKVEQNFLELTKKTQDLILLLYYERLLDNNKLKQNAFLGWLYRRTSLKISPRQFAEILKNSKIRIKENLENTDEDKALQEVISLLEESNQPQTEFLQEQQSSVEQSSKHSVSAFDHEQKDDPDFENDPDP